MKIITYIVCKNDE